ncbi:MAG: class I SAM-dependent methyltransferase [Candidatus Thorarchaeota archaeon]|nr:MAG: class I SAM-dependent methyltransferase [Candidatus Thorarchaeota archaeon]
MSLEENKKLEVGKEPQPRNQINLNPIRRLFENPQSSIEPYVKKGQVVADLGCNTGYYTFALAECVGPEGRVYAVDLKEDYVRELEKNASERGYGNIEAQVSSAHDLSFIGDESIDFVLANGLLCNMPDHRPSAVNEIRRILKPTGKAYLSLGAHPPFGFVDRPEWEKILEEFTVERRGGFLQRWAVVSKKDNGEQMSGNYVETSKRHRLRKLRKWLGE